jgi:DNA-binding CsgD family transcriptional regulator
MSPADVPSTASASWGRARLTAREAEVLRCLASGRTARAIGRELGVSELTIRKHLENVYAKLDVHDRLDAVLAAIRTGII